jgi:threonine/homoserine/homoserine lactone efflux protein
MLPAMTNRPSPLLTRRALVALAVFTMVDFVVCAALGNHGHGVRQTFADITWFVFLACVLLLVVGCGFVLARSTTARRAARG